MRTISDGGLGNAPAGADVIRRKLAPPPRPDHLVPRPRLDAALAALLRRHRVVRVCATAGAGKTTTVADGARKLGIPVAWLAVDHTDAAPGRLLTYIEAALAEVVPSVKGAATRALAAGLPHREAVGLLAQSADEGEVVFVLDELERLGDSAEAWAVIESLVRYAPAAMRIVLISRRDLPPALIQLPGDAGLASLGESDLAFTAAEAASALARREITVDDVPGVVEATGGWVTGVLFEAWRWRRGRPAVRIPLLAHPLAAERRRAGLPDRLLAARRDHRAARGGAGTQPGGCPTGIAARRPSARELDERLAGDALQPALPGIPAGSADAAQR
jgi:ATP/maltotriose-dependent transcriptional regulator MalT